MAGGGSYYSTYFEQPIVRENFDRLMRAKISDTDTTIPYCFNVSELSNIHGELYKGFSRANGIPELNTYALRDMGVTFENVVNIFFKKLYMVKYAELSRYEVIDEMAHFIADLYAARPFLFGNTRSIAIFSKRFLELQGYEVDIDKFIAEFNTFREGVQMASAVYLGSPVNGSQYDKLRGFLDGVLSDTRTYNSGYKAGHKK